MASLDVLNIGKYFLNLFIDWVRTIFVVPFHTIDMLWILIPVWLVWFFTEFFQEKSGTKMGNAITNSVIVLWGSIDCARQTTYWMAAHAKETAEVFLRFSLIALLFSYGAVIVWFGLKGKKIVTYIARIREVTYVFIMFVPIFYGAIPLSWNHIIAAVIYFPVFYYAIELIDRYAPNPTAVIIDEEESNGQTHKQESFDFNKPLRQEPPIGLPPQGHPPVPKYAGQRR